MVAQNVLREDYHTHVREDAFPMVPRGGGTLLDVGGGIGATAAKLREIGYIDRAGVIDCVAHNVTSLGLDFRHSGDLEDGDFVDDVIAAEGPFQCILCLDVLEHLRDPWSVVRQLHNALVPGGVIVASLPNVRNYKVLLPLLFRNEWTLTDAGVLDRTHLRFFVRSSAIDLMTSSGLVLDRIKPNPSGGRAVRLFRALTLGQMNSFTDLQYLIRVRRPMAPGRAQLAA